MHDPRLIREQPQVFKSALEKRGMDPSIIDEFLLVDAKRRELIQETQALREKQNRTSDEISALKRAKKEVPKEIIEEMRQLSADLKNKLALQREIEDKWKEILLSIPNLPHESVPAGLTEDENQEVRRWGELPVFPFQPKPHWEIGNQLKLFDLETAAEIAGSRFPLFQGWGAKLVRALINFMLDLHTKEHNYIEILPPLLANETSCLTSAHLPKFADDLFTTKEGFYLIPTAELPLANLHRDEILPAEVLPLKYVAYTPCFREEAGSWGKETRGLIRQHQFDKVELFKYTTPETSYDELEKLVQDAEEVLKRLGIPYRVVNVCAGDLGFSASKKYDIEAWFPGMGKFIEVSSCSNCTDFQARRGNIRFREHPEASPRFVHTLNGSGLAIGRTLAALIENYQEEDGRIRVPEALRPYINGVAHIPPKDG
ncbi:serine--tRNA ligase [bacterium]|nr:serine--tRNA ligase [bacterium]